VRSLLASAAFLTRLPAGRIAAFNAQDVAHASAWFPLIGLLLGAIYTLAVFLLYGRLPLYVIAVLLLLLEAIATGALHFDGLADTADGFGGGQSREDVLRIMRDHSIGAYGAVALILAIALKAAAYTALLKQSNWAPALILIPALGRWSILLLTAMLPYARPSASVVNEMGKWSLLWGTVIVLVALAAARTTRAWIAAALVVVVTAAFGFYCRRRIAGITGDTLGANLQICESAALLACIWLR
jgi:adenosylcobinamide-GDP ribazoletransferase